MVCLLLVYVLETNRKGEKEEKEERREEWRERRGGTVSLRISKDTKFPRVGTYRSSCCWRGKN